ncbi:hypothetical protein [Clostridium perfringens]|uniref:hypothetical protein n=1 Tax=Clostridium perfringens TaxID=1502 RepID=UPI0024685D27|nr:hypothetical protein [Clostridium perfringens]MDH5067163.1 hypothetical protein [Clostridium perfringens]
MGMRKKIRNKKGSRIKFRSNEYFSLLYNQALQSKTQANSNIPVSIFDENYLNTYLEKQKNGTLTKEELIAFDKAFINFLVS